MSNYRVVGYYLDSRGHAFTLVKVKILSGLRHQIRVQMHNLMWEMSQAKLCQPEDFGIVGDFEYLQPRTSDFDRQYICERIWLHEQTLGMWNPHDPSCLAQAKAAIPADLQACLNKMRKDANTNKQLEAHRKQQAKASELERFCQQFKICPGEKKDLLWWSQRHPEVVNHLMETFAKCLGDSSRELSIDGDYSFLLQGILSNMQRNMPRHMPHNAMHAAAELKDRLEEVLDGHITQRLEQQKQRDEKAEEVKSKELLPEGWRKFQSAAAGVHYLHDSGLKDKRKPVVDEGLEEGWVTFECKSKKGAFLFYHLTKRTTQFERPQQGDEVPDGWRKMLSSSGESEYYYHSETGTTQLGLPCSGPPEILPPNWEKVFKQKPKKPYYHNRQTGESTYTKPEYSRMLPPGWQEFKSQSTGKKYYWHQATNTSTFNFPEPQEERLEDEDDDLLADPPYAGAAENRLLPPGWQLCTSRSRGKTYYFHEATNTSQFDFPAEDPANDDAMDEEDLFGDLGI